MAEKKHHVFSARTTGEGLRLLSELRAERGVGWDELVIGAVCAHYGLDRGVMAIPKPVRSEKAVKDKKPRKTKAKEETSKST